MSPMDDESVPNEVTEQEETPVKKSSFERSSKRPIFDKLPEKMKDRTDWIGIAPHHVSSPELDASAWKPMDNADMPFTRNWALVLDDAQYTASMHDYPYKAINDGGNYRLALKHTNAKGETKVIGIAPRTGNIDNIQGDTKVTGKRFMTVARKRRGSDGVEVMFPLPHTGIWIAVKPAKDLRWLSFDTERSERRATVGRDTAGLSLSARSGYEQQDILDFIIEHITDINVLDYTPETILQHIDMLDIPVIIWGFLSAQYVNGHPVRIPCMVDPSKCNHVQEVLIRIANMGWLDSDKLTPKQMEFISDYRAQRTAEEVRQYRQEFSRLSDEVVTLSDGTEITLSIPTAAESMFVARRWVEDVISEIDKSLARSGRGKQVGEDRRLTYLMRGMQDTQLREYIPWIKKIGYTLDGGVGDNASAWSDEISDIENWCEEVSSDMEITKELYEAVKKFMSDRTIAIIGYPAVKCPKCQGGHEIGSDEYLAGDFETIVPLDMIKCFLVLMVRRLENTQALHPLSRTGR